MASNLRSNGSTVAPAAHSAVPQTSLLVVLSFRYRPIGVVDPRPMWGHDARADTTRDSSKEVIGCERSLLGGSGCCSRPRHWPLSRSRLELGTSPTRARPDLPSERKGPYASQDRVLPRRAGRSGHGRGRGLPPQLDPPASSTRPSGSSAHPGASEGLVASARKAPSPSAVRKA